MEMYPFFNCDEPRRPRRDAPAAVLMNNLLKPHCPAVPRRGPEAGENHINDFHDLGVNLMVHARFYKVKNSNPNPVFFLGF